ncbi:hypothetical protein [uncultured Ruegeria sp.]|uniref:hypothetical protein n=1 Tax=uncultured Ruegeria sp. TaxID=259304 RepID=UPI002638CC21|nr:hypothetical protein [uncultured Ruegeria sp.]
MVQNNKVLTVSYGTFSCTLEGFDNSFETLKAIADYFRELAADDRYFGSEPPQPDAEMLNRIAQRNPSQHIEASHSEAGLLLRATEAAAPSTATAPEEQTSQAASLNMIETPAPEAQTEPDVAKTDRPVGAAAAPADSIASKLQRIRAVVSHSDANPQGYVEDEDTSLLKSKEAPADALTAAFEAGALSSEDLQPANVKSPFSMDDPQPVTETAQKNDPQTDEILFSDLDETSEVELEDDGMLNILSDEEVVSQPEGASIEDAPGQTTEGVITAEDEADLLDEISEVESKLSDPSGIKLAEKTDPDQDVFRLMEEAGTQMEDPANNNKRETYSHLRTAVAATEAARKVEGDAGQKSLDQDYRGDLASVVSPRRPDTNTTSARPDYDSAAPLKLVAEQRVDDETEDAGPVSPRRVSTQLEDAGPEEGGFAQFAREQEAQSLPDLLEAAAAYLSFIEGQEQFSRPQLMNKVRSFKQDEFDREESLRSFGQLLRDGKIQKAGGGRFAASHLIGFRPDDARAAG